MASSPRLETHRTTLRERLFPAYEPLGHLTLVYLLGSMENSYWTARASASSGKAGSVPSRLR